MFLNRPVDAYYLLVRLLIGSAVHQQASSLMQSPQRHSQEIGRVSCFLTLHLAPSASPFYKARWSSSILTLAGHQVVRQQCFHFICHRYLESSMIRTSCWPILLDDSTPSNLPTITVTRVAPFTKQGPESDTAVTSPSGTAIVGFGVLSPVPLSRLMAREPHLRPHQRLQLWVSKHIWCYRLSLSHPYAPWEVHNSLKISSTDASGNEGWESQGKRICAFFFLIAIHEPHYYFGMSLEAIKPFAIFHLCPVSRRILQLQVWRLQIGWLLLHIAQSSDYTISRALTFLLLQGHDSALSSFTPEHALLHWHTSWS